ncbi:MAG: hypothetical protein JXN61_03345 [Sedimentisphaerales bacterium]|nr:hypothetical protein [Sedimentisphaerales bacterium]
MLGAAQHRLGSCKETLKTLTGAERILSQTGDDPDPKNMAFTAMTLHKLGRFEEARAALEPLRPLCKEERFAEDEEAQAVLAEAEELIGGKNE